MDPILVELAHINATVVRPKQEALLNKEKRLTIENVTAGNQTVPRHRQSSVCDVDGVVLPVCELSGVSQDTVLSSNRCPHSPRPPR